MQWKGSESHVIWQTLVFLKALYKTACFAGEVTSVIFLTWQRVSQGWNLGILSCTLLHSFSLPFLLLLANEKTHNSNLLLQANLTQTNLPLLQLKRSVVGVEDFCGQQSCGVTRAVWELRSLEHPLPPPKMHTTSQWLFTTQCINLYGHSWIPAAHCICSATQVPPERFIWAAGNSSYQQQAGAEPLVHKVERRSFESLLIIWRATLFLTFRSFKNIWDC